MSVINVKSQTELSGFHILFRGGIQKERKGFFGVQHLCEHIFFKSLEPLLNDFDRYGISNNAYTSENEVLVYFYGLDENLSNYREEILSKLLSFDVTEEDFNREKLVVIKEYLKYFNVQEYSHGLNLNRKLFGSFGPIGLKEDLDNLSYDDFMIYFRDNFSKPHTIINVSKNSEFSTDIEFSTESFDDVIHYGQYDVPYEPYEGRNGISSIIYLSEVILDDFAHVDFICDMLGSGLQSPLYKIIRSEKSLCYSLSCSLDRMTNKSGLVCISSETTDENVEVFQKTVEYILSNPDIFMTQERFDIVKQALEINIKKSEINRYSNVNKYITPKEWLIEPILKDLTLEKIMEVYSKYFDFSKYYKSIDVIEFPESIKE